MSLLLRPDNRLFVALDLPTASRRALAALGRDRAARVEGRAVPEASLHLTLRFLGRVGVERGSRLLRALSSLAGTVGPRLQVARVEARPSAQRARLLAAVVEDVTGDLAEVHARLSEAVATALDIAADPGALWPHVTLVRLRRPVSVAEAVGSLDPGECELAFDVSRASLYDSQTSPGGRRHLSLASVDLIAQPDATPKTR